MMMIQYEVNILGLINYDNAGHFLQPQMCIVATIHIHLGMNGDLFKAKI